MSMLLRRNRRLAQESKQVEAPKTEVKEEKREAEKPSAKPSAKGSKKKA